MVESRRFKMISYCRSGTTPARSRFEEAYGSHLQAVRDVRFLNNAWHFDGSERTRQSKSNSLTDLSGAEGACLVPNVYLIDGVEPDEQAAWEEEFVNLDKLSATEFFGVSLLRETCLPPVLEVCLVLALLLLI